MPSIQVKIDKVRTETKTSAKGNVYMLQDVDIYAPGKDGNPPRHPACMDVFVEKNGDNFEPFQPGDYEFLPQITVNRYGRPEMTGYSIVPVTVKK